MTHIFAYNGLTFLESSRRADVKLLTCRPNAATYRFRDIRGQIAKI